MVGPKLTHLRDGWHKSNSPKGWTDGELYRRHENNLPKDGELNASTKITRPGDVRPKNNSPKQGWTDGQLNSPQENNSPKNGKLNGRHENYSPKGWTTQK